MTTKTAAELVAAIRAARNLTELTRLVGPSPAEVQSLNRAIAQLERMDRTMATEGTTPCTLDPVTARAYYRLQETVADFETRYITPA